MKRFFLSLFGVSAVIASFAQSNFEGKIIFKADLMGEGAEMAKSMMPDTYEYWVGNGSMLFKMNGGMAGSILGNILISADGNTYLIKDSEKTFYKLKNDEAEKTSKNLIEAQDEMISILGYECKKYKIEAEVSGTATTQYAWVTDKFKFDISPKNKVSGAAGGIWIDGVKGIPLKIMASVMGMTSVLTATELKEEKLPKNTFKIPKGYAEKEFDPKSMFGF